MIYTVGYKINYDKYMRDYPNLKKKGQDGDYSGGIVWQTSEDALNYLRHNDLEGYGVYGVDGSWDTDVYMNTDGQYYLKYDRLLIRLN